MSSKRHITQTATINGSHMKILIVGNMGYVGPAVVQHLRDHHRDAILHGFDSGYFAHCLTGAPCLPERVLDQQFFGDVRRVSKSMMAGYDAIVQLAAISNDPMGEEFSAVTREINQDSAIAIARAAAEAGVKNFVFASSCSVYGVADARPRREDDPLNPMTAYARSKVGTEQALAALETDMTITCLRFATACGMSPRLRLDLVLNDFVASALSQRAITVLSDGSPWRPLIDVADMARAIDWAIQRHPQYGGRYLVVNTGSDARNHQIRDLARSVADAIPGTDVSINTEAPVDSRSYRVDFALFAALSAGFSPVVTLQDSIARLIAGLQAMNFNDTAFRTSGFVRLHALRALMRDKRLSPELVWL
jgi:nucleoside-diphosphate-sugar epimerase